MSRKPADYCKIVQYLEYNNAPLHDAINVLCAWSEFRKPKGVTLLEPDASVCKEIQALAYKNADKAMELLRRHIVPTFVPDVGKLAPGFTNSQSERQDAKGSSSKVSVGKAEITPQPAWKPRDRVKTREQVFRLKGDLGTGAKSAKGGAILMVSEMDEAKHMDINTLTLLAEQKIAGSVKNRYGVDPYLNALVAFLQYCEVHGVDTKDIDRVFQLGSPEPAITWWLMTKPYCPSSLPFDHEPAIGSGQGCLLTTNMARLFKKWLLDESEVALSPSAYYADRFKRARQGGDDSRKQGVVDVLENENNIAGIVKTIRDHALQASEGQMVWGQNFDACKGVSLDLILHTWEVKFLAEQALLNSDDIGVARDMVKCAQKYPRNQAPLLSGALIQHKPDDSIALFWGSLVHYLCAYHCGGATEIGGRHEVIWAPNMLQHPNDCTFKAQEHKRLHRTVIESRGKGLQSDLFARYSRLAQELDGLVGQKDRDDDNVGLPMPADDTLAPPPTDEY